MRPTWWIWGQRIHHGDGGWLVRTVFSFADNTGLSLDVSALPDWDSFTFVSLFEFDQTIAYRRILQTKNFTDGHGLDWNTSRLAFYSGGNGPSGVHRADRFEQVDFVNNHGSLSGYVDGVL